MHHHSSVSSRPSIQPSPSIVTSSSRRQSSLIWASCLTLSCQCASTSPVSQTCFFHPRRIRSVRRQLGRDVTAKLVTALVLSRLDHCNAVLAGLPTLPATTLAPLQRVLHAAARTVLDLKLGDHVTPALRELHWLPITERIQYKLCLLVHKMFAGHAPDYIASLLMPASDIPHGRRCVHRVTERVLVTGLSLLPHPMLEIGCRPT